MLAGKVEPVHFQQPQVKSSDYTVFRTVMHLINEATTVSLLEPAIGLEPMTC